MKEFKNKVLFLTIASQSLFLISCGDSKKTADSADLGSTSKVAAVSLPTGSRGDSNTDLGGSTGSGGNNNFVTTSPYDEPNTQCANTGNSTPYTQIWGNFPNVGNWKSIRIPRGQSISFSFEASSWQGNYLTYLTTLGGVSGGFTNGGFISGLLDVKISTCAGDVVPAPGNDCYMRASEVQVMYSVGQGDSHAMVGRCKLQEGQRYYINIRCSNDAPNSPFSGDCEHHHLQYAM